MPNFTHDWLCCKEHVAGSLAMISFCGPALSHGLQKVKFATLRRPTKGHVQGLTRAKTCYQACVYRCGQDSASRSTHRPREGKMASSMLRTLVCHLHLTLVTTHILFLERPCAGSCDHDFEVCPIGAAWFGCYSGACLLAMCVCVCTLFAQVGLLLDEQDCAKRLVTSQPRKPVDAKEGGHKDFAVSC